MPVPVVVPASAWDPDQDLLDWVAEQLSLTHSGLAVPVKAATGEITTLANALVRDGTIPIIDGFDELPAARRGDAITRLNALGSDFPLVLTSRPGLPGPGLSDLLRLRSVEFPAVVGHSGIAKSSVTALDISRSASPPESLRMDRKVVAVETLSGAVVRAVLFFLWSGTAVLSAYVIYALVATVVRLFAGGTERASSAYAEARLLLACGRFMPWRLMSFLADAHRRGALRQVGAVYEFRHVRLQQRLAAGRVRWPGRLEAMAGRVLGEQITESIVQVVHRASAPFRRALTAAATSMMRAAHVDDEKHARIHGWQVTGRGRARSYRDPRFDALSAVDGETDRRRADG
jgi:hypothetical protein